MAVPVIAARAQSTSGGSTVSSLNISLPSGTVEGTYLWILAGSDATSLTTFTATNFTELVLAGSAASDAYISAQHGYVSAGQVSQGYVTVNVSVSAQMYGFSLRITGVDEASPIHGNPHTSLVVKSTILGGQTDASVTTIDDCLIVSMVSGDGGDMAPWTVDTSGGGDWDGATVFEETSGTGGNDASGGYATINYPTAGRVDGARWTASSSDGISLGIFAIAPLDADALVPVTGLVATGSVGSVTVDAEATAVLTGTDLVATGSVGTVTVAVAQTVVVNGLEAAGEVDAVTISGIANVPVTGLEATGEVGTATASIPETVVVTGLEATGAVDTVSVFIGADVPVTGVEGTGAVGDVTVTGIANFSVTGLEATGAVGTAEGLAGATAPITGLSAAGSVGTATVITGAGINVPVTGLEATGSVGTAIAAIGSGVAVTGLEATGSVGTAIGSVSWTWDAGHFTFDDGLYHSMDGWHLDTPGQTIVTPDGVSGTGEVGTVTVTVVASVDVPVTGLEASGSVDTVAVTGDGNVLVTGLEGTGAIGDVTVDEGSVPIDVPVTGLEATGSVGSVAISLSKVVPVTGLEATGSVNDVTVTGTAVVIPTGISTTGSVGSVVVQVGDGITVGVGGIEATGEVGTAAVVGVANIPVTGLEATGAVDDVVIAVAQTAPVTGLEATGEVGSVTILEGAGIDVPVTGLEAAGEVDSVTVVGDSNTLVTGLEATGEIGAVSVQTENAVTVAVTGVTASGEVGSPTVTGIATVTTTGLSATGDVGTVIVSLPVTVGVTGLEATASVGSVNVTFGATVIPTGIAATGEIGDVIVTGAANVSVTGLEATGSVGSVLADQFQDVTVIAYASGVGYFDASIAGPTDADSNWVNDANAFDGDESTFSTGTGVLLTGLVNALTGIGNTLPWPLPSPNSVVDFRFNASVNGSNTAVRAVGRVSSSGTGLVSALSYGSNPSWSPWTTVPPIILGGTWDQSTLDNLEILFGLQHFKGVLTDGSIYKAEIRIDIKGVGEVGDVTIVTDANVAVTGVEATGEVGDVFIINIHTPNQEPGWTDITAGSTNWEDYPVKHGRKTENWTEITPTEDPDWDDGSIAN